MRFLSIAIIFLLLLYGCSASVDKGALVGTWDYIQIESLNPSSEENTTKEDLKAAKPYIRFTADNKVQIVWEGKVLSSGTYRVDGNMIRYNEDLEGGRKREFPFLINSISNEQIVFQTMSNENTRVTAVKRK